VIIATEKKVISFFLKKTNNLWEINDLFKIV